MSFTGRERKQRLINDDTTSLNTTWSSQRITDIKFDHSDVIDDDKTTDNFTWSSKKINNELNNLEEDLDVTVTTDVTYKIPSDYPTLQDAIDDLGQYPVTSKPAIELRIESGHKPKSGIDIDNEEYGNYGHFIITADDEEVEVADDFSGPVIRAYGAVAPRLGCLIDARHRGGDGYSLEFNAQGYVARDCGVIYAGGRGLYAGDNSRVFARSCIFDHAWNRGLWITRASVASVEGGSFCYCNESEDVATSNSVRRASVVNAQDAKFDHNFNTGINATRSSSLNMSNGSASNNAEKGVIAERCSIVSLEGSGTATVDNNGHDGVRVFNFAFVSAKDISCQGNSWNDFWTVGAGLIYAEGATTSDGTANDFYGYMGGVIDDGETDDNLTWSSNKINEDKQDTIPIFDASDSESLTIKGILKFPDVDGTSATYSAFELGEGEHRISEFGGDLVMYPNRATGGFRIRSHEDRNNFRNVMAANAEGNVCIGALDSQVRLEVMKDSEDMPEDAVRARYNLHLHNAGGSRGNAVGMCFTQFSASADGSGDWGDHVPGAAILHEREGDSSVGSLQFRTKENTGTLDPCLERMRITRYGNVGIGTTDPSERLEVDGSIKCTTLIADNVDGGDGLPNTEVFEGEAQGNNLVGYEVTNNESFVFTVKTDANEEVGYRVENGQHALQLLARDNKDDGVIIQWDAGLDGFTGFIRYDQSNGTRINDPRDQMGNKLLTEASDTTIGQLNGTSNSDIVRTFWGTIDVNEGTITVDSNKFSDGAITDDDVSIADPGFVRISLPETYEEQVHAMVTLKTNPFTGSVGAIWPQPADSYVDISVADPDGGAIDLNEVTFEFSFEIRGRKSS